MIEIFETFLFLIRNEKCKRAQKREEETNNKKKVVKYSENKQKKNLKTFIDICYYADDNVVLNSSKMLSSKLVLVDLPSIVSEPSIFIENKTKQKKK